MKVCGRSMSGTRGIGDLFVVCEMFLSRRTTRSLPAASGAAAEDRCSETVQCDLAYCYVARLEL